MCFFLKFQQIHKSWICCVFLKQNNKTYFLKIKNTFIIYLRKISDAEVLHDTVWVNFCHKSQKSFLLTTGHDGEVRTAWGSELKNVLSCFVVKETETSCPAGFMDAVKMWNAEWAASVQMFTQHSHQCTIFTGASLKNHRTFPSASDCRHELMTSNWASEESWWVVLVAVGTKPDEQCFMLLIQNCDPTIQMCSKIWEQQETANRGRRGRCSLVYEFIDPLLQG